MSLDTCKSCCTFVDTDYDGDFYYVTLEDGTDIESRGFCQCCREDLSYTVEKTEEFIREVSDFATPALREALYEFKRHTFEKIEGETCELNKQSKSSSSDIRTHPNAKQW